MSIKNISNQKSVLAKLLAQENLTVEHKKVPTAYFDPKNRVLCLPIWKDMSSDVYDLLVGHEVGHAWETPAEGWHTAIEAKGKGFKSFLNVVEDARIEKLIKSRYPGIKAPMYRGYKELFDQDFFGVREKDISTISLIDRLNVHFKLGSLMNVPFKDTEQIFVTRMDNLKSWDDVYALASDLYDYEKANPSTNLDDLEEGEMGLDGDFDGDFDDLDDDDEGTVYGNKGGKDYEPESATDVAFREKELTLLTNDFHPYVYVNLNTVDLKKIIVDYKTLYEKTDFSKMNNYADHLKAIFGSDISNEKYDEEKDIFNPTILMNDYKGRNSKFIAYLVKEFELRRNAAQYARASVSKTGELDTEKVWSYKLKDDLFKRVTKIPLGKNHAMIMFIDWSGSMSNNLTNTIEQFLILADFCRKVNIPFEVYAFSDNGFNFMNRERELRNTAFSRKPKELLIDNSHFKLLNFLSSTMSNSQYRNAQIKLLQIAKCFDDGDKYPTSYSRYRSNFLPAAVNLSGTPLNEAILAANYIVSEYKKVNKIDVMNTIFLTDGDGADINCIVDSDRLSPRSIKATAGSTLYNLVLTDKATNLSVVAKPGELVTSALLRMLKVKSDSSIVGYFITTRSIKNTALNLAAAYGSSITAEKVQEEIRKTKFYSVKDIGFDEYFVVQTKDLEVQEDKLQVESPSKRDFYKAFMKNQKAKIINRVLLNKFIQQIA